MMIFLCKHTFLHNPKINIPATCGADLLLPPGAISETGLLLKK